MCSVLRLRIFLNMYVFLFFFPAPEAWVPCQRGLRLLSTRAQWGKVRPVQLHSAQPDAAVIPLYEQTSMRCCCGYLCVCVCFPETACAHKYSARMERGPQRWMEKSWKLKNTGNVGFVRRSWKSSDLASYSPSWQRGSLCNSGAQPAYFFTSESPIP